jgi:hypothetical protein
MSDDELPKMECSGKNDSSKQCSEQKESPKSKNKNMLMQTFNRISKNNGKESLLNSQKTEAFLNNGRDSLLNAKKNFEANAKESLLNTKKKFEEFDAKMQAAVEIARATPSKESPYVESKKSVDLSKQSPDKDASSTVSDSSNKSDNLFMSTLLGATANLEKSVNTAVSKTKQKVDASMVTPVKKASAVKNSSPTTSNSAKNNNDHEHEELLVGYKILHVTLKKESQLKFLHWLRDATFRGPKGSLKTVLEAIYQTSEARFNELEALFRDHEPKILLKDAPSSSMGDSIQDDVEKASQGELVPLPGSSRTSKAPPHLQWGVRFVFIQAQATRMVVSLATSLGRFERNESRKEWLAKLALEFEAIRERLVDCVLLNLVEEAWSDAQSQAESSS